MAENINISEAFNLHSSGKLDEAAKIYIEFLEENPKQPEVSNLLGLIYLQKKVLDKAELYFKYAVEGFPCAEYYQNLGLAFYNRKEYPKAMDNFSKAVEFEPNNIDFIRNFIEMAKKSNQIEKAIEFSEISLKTNPKDSLGYNNLGLLYEKLHDYNSAKVQYQKSLKLKQNYEALHNLGILYRTERNFDESIKCLKNALKFKPHNGETMISLGMSYLSKKDINRGFKYLHESDACVLNKKNKKDYKNDWDGELHTDKTILVFYNAGFGDHIMFSRYVPLLKSYFKKVKVLVPFSLKALFRSGFPDIEIAEFTDNEYDFSVNIIELPYILKKNFDSIPFSDGYFKADAEIVERYKTEYFKSSKKKIGLFWQGSKKVLKNRSVKLKEFEPLFEIKDFEFYSFEVEDEESQIKSYPDIINIANTFNTFSDTAGALMNLDLLITVDSAIAHLAGALGVKTYLLLPYASEWRWFTDEKSTPWYDSVTIFKQKEHYNWTDVIFEAGKSIKTDNFQKALDTKVYP